MSTRIPTRSAGAEVAASLMPWEPVIDGDVLPARPIDRIAAGAGAGVDVMVGTNTDEWRLFLVPSGAIDQVTNEALVAVVAAYGLPVEATLSRLSRGTSRRQRPAICLRQSRPTGIGASPPSAWPRPMRRAPRPPTCTSSPGARRSSTGRLGACHALEIPFVFDTLGNGTEPLLGTNPPQQLADAMHAAWVAFATSGDPGWPQYDLKRRATMRFDTTSEVVDDPRSAERALWEGQR